MTMKQRLISADVLSEILEISNLYVGDDVKIRNNNYSGRGMYGGEPCWGIVYDCSSVMPKFLVNAGIVALEREQNEQPGFHTDDVNDLAGVMCTDSMGHGAIMYFPGWQIDGWQDEDDE
jgi:hypothetical protein